MSGQRNDYGKRLHSQSDISDNSKRRNPTDERESNAIGPEDTVYRYLCPLGRIGSVIGVGGDIAKQLRAETNSKIRISETVPGCDERVVTIYSSNEETNIFGDGDELISPAQDALFKVHDRIIAEDMHMDDEFGEPKQVTVRLLVPSDQIGCVIGKGGQVIQNIRGETRAQVRVLSSEHLPPCALGSDELIQITGEAAVVKRALYLVASRLHNNPSRTQHQLFSSASIYRSGGALVNSNVCNPPAVASLMGPYGSYRSDGRDRYAAIRDFSVRLVCPMDNIGAVIGKSGTVVKQLRQDSGASIKIDSSGAQGDDCIILVSAKEAFEDSSPTIDATMRVQPLCSEKTEKESGDPVITTRLLVPSSRIGCLIGKGGAIITEMRRATRASIRILAEENLPKVAAEDDEMVQITGDSSVASAALLQVLMRLRANIFEMEGASVALPPVFPYHPTSLDMSDSQKYDKRSRHQGYTYSSGYDVNEMPPSDTSSGYGGPQVGRGSAYGIYSSGRPSNAGFSSQNPVSYGKPYGY